MQRELWYDGVFDAQEHYRLLLDCMARPGEVRVLPASRMSAPEGIHGAAALVGFALLNADASFFAAGSAGTMVSEYLRENTDGLLAEPDIADFIFMPGGAGGLVEVVARAKRGTLPYPEGGATLVLSVAGLDEGAGPDGL